MLVLGVHRSGTSSLAHLLNLLGAKLPDRVLGPQHGNPLGHWEPLGLMAINDEILSSIGRSWKDPRPIPRSWFRSKAAYVFHKRIAAEINSSYGNAGLILIKEPRICRLAPLYIDVLDSLGIEPLVIIPVRHPREVIRSIQERDELDPSTIELVWLRSLVEAEEASRGCTRVWSSFDGLLRDWQTAVQSIALELRIVWPNSPENIADRAAHVVRPRQRHHRVADGMPSLSLSPLTVRAWRAAQYGLRGDEPAARAAFDEIRAPIWELDRLNLSHAQGVEKSLAEANELVKNSGRLAYQLNLVRGSILKRLGRPFRRYLKRG
jgi:hypothetical protein